MKIIFIRHGMTEGNLEKRYIGKTDEHLCEAGICDIEKYKTQGLYPAADRLFVSPMKRCIETAKLIYPALTPVVVDDFRECDFGAFEGKNYQELADDQEYRQWIDSNGTLPFPGGESVTDFKRRCVGAFEEYIVQCIENNIAIVAHGGTIMALMEHFAEPKKGYYDYQVTNGMGYITDYREGRLWDVGALR